MLAAQASSEVSVNVFATVSANVSAIVSENLDVGSKILMLASKIIIDGVGHLDVGVKNLHTWGRKS
eukprot:11742513-Karenia_brevis.AAC.1